jgi:hypothetical protein
MKKTTLFILGALMPAAASAQMQCLPCAAGTYSSGGGATSCLPCPAGKYCPAGTGTPISCPAGSTSVANSKSENDCACPAGKYKSGNSCATCPASSYCTGTTSPIACPFGTYSVAGATSCTKCSGGGSIHTGWSYSTGFSCAWNGSSCVVGDCSTYHVIFEYDDGHIDSEWLGCGTRELSTAASVCAAGGS